MNGFRSALAGSLLLIASLAPALAAAQEAAQEGERILRFHADLRVSTDASIEVIETITVRAEGNQIQRGIYRDVPMRGFRPDDVVRDGEREDYFTEPYGSGTRVYIGNADVYLDPGEYTYMIRYRMPLEVRFFDDLDEVYWNVTGTAWAFPIDAASATVVLPEPVAEEFLEIDAWTGAERSVEQQFEAEVSEPGVVEFRATRGLYANEGLTVGVRFPKGIVQEPSETDLVIAYLGALGITGIELGAIGVVLLYYLTAWAIVGKDPSPGRVVPTEIPPQGHSPAACLFVKRMGYQDGAFTAALLNMAVKGYLRIEQDAEENFTIVRDTAPESVLEPDEAVLAKGLFDGRTEITLTRANQATLASAIKAFRETLGRQYEKEYFRSNGLFMLPGLGMSAIALLVIAWSSPMEDFMATLFMTVWLGGWTMGVAALVAGTITAWVSLFLRREGGGIVGTLFITLFALPFVGGEIAGFFMLTMASSFGYAIALVLFMIIHVVFYVLMKAPTSLGRRFLDELDGFEMFLKGEGRARFASNAPALFEKYLPYAIALGREAEWTRDFEQALAAATSTQTDYHPRWYHTSSAKTFATAGMMTGLAASLGSAVSSATTTSSSSSGGSFSSGGGSSGGGGGGGGGGGW